jgi:hypothetical protein
VEREPYDRHGSASCSEQCDVTLVPSALHSVPYAPPGSARTRRQMELNRCLTLPRRRSSDSSTAFLPMTFQRTVHSSRSRGVRILTGYEKQHGDRRRADAARPCLDPRTHDSSLFAGRVRVPELERAARGLGLSVVWWPRIPAAHPPVQKSGGKWAIGVDHSLAPTAGRRRVRVARSVLATTLAGALHAAAKK